MDLLVDGQPFQSGGPPAAGRVILHALAAAVRRHGWRVDVVANEALPAFDAPEGVTLRPFSPPGELTGLPGAIAIYYADWLLARRPDVLLVPGLFPPRGVVPHFVGRAPRVAAVIDPTAWARAVESLGRNPSAADGMNFLVRAACWFDFVPPGTRTWADSTDCGTPPRVGLPFGMPPSDTPPPLAPLPHGLVGRSFLFLDAARLSGEEVREWLAVHRSAPAEFRSQFPLAVTAPSGPSPADGAGRDVVVVRNLDRDRRAALIANSRAVLHSFRETDSLVLAEGLFARRALVAPVTACDPRSTGYVHPFDPSAGPADVAVELVAALASPAAPDRFQRLSYACRIDDTADALKAALTADADPSASRKRIAWVEQPCAGSAVSGWTGQLRSALATAYDIDTVSAGHATLQPDELAAAQRHRPHDLVVYHVANRAADATLLRLARTVPGLVVFHDTDVAGLARAALGVASADPYSDVADEVGPDNALACYSPDAYQKFRQITAMPTCTLPRGVPEAPERPVSHVRQQLNLPLGLFLVGVWAAEGNAAQVGTVFEAVSGLPEGIRDRVRVVVTGHATADDRERARYRAAELGMANHAIWRFDEDPETDPAFARAVDVCVALGGTRDGELALRTLYGLASGSVCVAQDGCLPGLPADPVTVRVRPEDLVAELRRTLERLYTSVPLRQQLGRAGRAFVAGEASLGVAVAHLHGLIEQVARDRAAADVAWTAAVRRAVGDGLSDFAAADWIRLRTRSAPAGAGTRVVRYVAPPALVADRRPPRVAAPAAGRRLWISMSHVLAGHRGHYTGISRMVVSVARELVRQRMANVRYCRIHEDHGVGFLTEVAQSAAEAHISADVTAPINDLHRYTAYTPIDFRPGDVLFCPEVGFSPRYFAYLRRIHREGRVTIVPFVHDLIAAKYPHYFGANGQAQFWQYGTTTIDTADLILVNSKHTAKDVEWFAGVNNLSAPPVEVIRLGDEDLIRTPIHHLKGVAGLTPGDRFAMVCCTIEVRKNHRILYEVWRRMLAAHGPARTPKLICVGRVGWMVQDFVDQVRADPHTRDHFLLLENVNDAELTWLYKHCLFALYPSLYEGWGMPVGEALAAGKYMVVSNSSSIPEIGGNLVDYHDPMDVMGCQALVERAAFDDDYREMKEARIRAAYRSTSWLDCARQIADAIQRHTGPLTRSESRVRRIWAA